MGCINSTASTEEASMHASQDTAHPLRLPQDTAHPLHLPVISAVGSFAPANSTLSGASHQTLDFVNLNLAVPPDEVTEESRSTTPTSDDMITPRYTLWIPGVGSMPAEDAPNPLTATAM